MCHTGALEGGDRKKQGKPKSASSLVKGQLYQQINWVRVTHVEEAYMVWGQHREKTQLG